MGHKPGSPVFKLAFRVFVLVPLAVLVVNRLAGSQMAAAVAIAYLAGLNDGVLAGQIKRGFEHSRGILRSHMAAINGR